MRFASLRALKTFVGLAALAGVCMGCLTQPAPQGGTDESSRENVLEVLAPRRVLPVLEEDVATQFLRLQWTSVPGATAYEVHLGIDTNPPTVAVVRLPEFTVRDLPACTKHYWRVVAIEDDTALISSTTYSFTTRCPPHSSAR